MIPQPLALLQRLQHARIVGGGARVPWGGGYAGLLQILNARYSGTLSKIADPRMKTVPLMPRIPIRRPQPGWNLGARRERGRGQA